MKWDRDLITINHIQLIIERVIPSLQTGEWFDNYEKWNIILHHKVWSKFI